MKDTKTVIEELKEEKRLLDEKTKRLKTFLNSEPSLNVSVLQFKLLHEQNDTMEKYSFILSQRIKDLES